MPNEIPMPPGGAEQGESAWSAAEKMAEAHEASLRAEGRPVPGEQAGSIVSSEPPPVADASKPEPAKKPAPKATVPESDKSAIRKQIEELAAKAGMKVDGNRVEVAERVALREERRVMREAMSRELEKQRSQLTEKERAAEAKREKFEAFEAAHSKSDLEGMAKAAGFASWRELVNEETKRMASPEYRRVQELEKREQEREKAEKEREARAAEEHAQRERVAGIQAYKVSMAEQMKEAGGELEHMADDADLVNMLYDVRAAHFQRTREELDLQELLDTPTPLLGGKTPLDKLRSMRDSLNAIFGDHPADLDEAASAAARRGGQSSRSRERKPPKVVSQRNAAEASAQPTFDDTPEGQKAYKAYFTQLLNQSTHPS